MTDRYEEILRLYTKIVLKNGKFDVDGLQRAFKEFCASLAVQPVKPKPIATTNNSSYVKTTLAEAIQRAKQPVVIPVKTNEHGNLESTIYPGLVFKEVKDGDETYHVCYGFQDGKNIAPLSINQLRVCQANGWRFDVNNTVGCATTVSSDYAVKL